eukprot:CAMPEP_0198218126 /NCGR_PEP_ID=MMETSP1445-20131203/67554_1 /TAXON_ID=36898 /ORGANISM="Pyramimonas sp., Strain CCMP2087" /LENGTH=216 /DNA_ID=CAMNT_0043895035 /DNA_START=259 /DNA_END=909 /DNA_ORIENTATION=+
MATFYKDCLRFGCLGEFKHFGLYLRGREELLVTVRHNASLDMCPTPKITRSATFGERSEHVPPASPATREMQQIDPKETVFLIGAYARYNWPYVWLRSNLGKYGTNSADKDLPLDLNTTSKWETHGYRVWDIVAELLHMNILPNPENPFEVDLASFDKMDPMERTLQAGAMAFFLRDLLLQNSRLVSYHKLVQEDILALLQIHFRTLSTLTPNVPQ